MDDGDLLLPAEVPHALANCPRRLPASGGGWPGARDFRSQISAAQLLPDTKGLEPLAKRPLADLN